MLRKVRIGLGLLLLAGSILFLIWGYWPVHRETRTGPVSESAGLDLPETRALTLEFPPQIRVGEPAVVRLMLHPNDQENALPADPDQGSNFAAGGAEAAEFYGTHTVIAEARFDMPGMNVRPSELISAPISQGQSAIFFWTLRPAGAGQYRATIWLYLRIIDKLTGQESRETVSAQLVEIEAVEFWRLTAGQARTVGLLGLVIGLSLCLPFLWSLIGSFERKKPEKTKIG